MLNFEWQGRPPPQLTAARASLCAKLQGRMDVLMQIDGTHIEGAMGKEFVKRGICPELSLGYHVTMSRSPAGFLKASNKKVVELSLVRQGARCVLYL